MLITILILILSVAFLALAILERNNATIIDIQTDMILKLKKLFELEEKNNRCQDKEIIEILRNLNFIMKKQIEMRANHALLVRRIDNIFKEKIFVSKENFENSLKKIEEKFAHENQEIFQKIEKIDSFQKMQHKRLKNLEALADVHHAGGGWDFK